MAGMMALLCVLVSITTHLAVVCALSALMLALVLVLAHAGGVAGLCMGCGDDSSANGYATLGHAGSQKAKTGPDLERANFRLLKPRQRSSAPHFNIKRFLIL